MIAQWMKARMRKNILILGHNYATQFVDICNQYVKTFDPEQYKVTVAYLSGEPNEAAKEKTLAEEVLFLNCSKRDIRGLKIKAIKKLIALCRERNFAIIVCHRYKPTYIMLWAAQFVKIPVIFFVMHAMKTLDFITRRLLIAGLARKNMYFAGVSKAVRDDMFKHMWRVPEKHVITLHNCIDTAITEPNILSREAARDFFHLPHDAFVYGTLGRLAPEKDQANLIKAFSRVKLYLPRAKLLLIGDGPLEHDLRKLTQELKLTDDVIFAGFLPQGFRYLKAMDVFALTSTKEAFGRVLLEAMLAKVPVIGTHTNGIPEVVSGAGIIVKARNSELLAAAMLHYAAFSTDELQQIGEKVYEHVHKKFSIEKFRDVFWQTWLIREMNAVE